MTTVFRVNVPELRRMREVSRIGYKLNQTLSGYIAHLSETHNCTLAETDRVNSQHHSRRFFLTFSNDEDVLLATLYFGGFNES